MLAKKCHLLIFDEKTINVSVQIGATLVTESVKELILLKENSLRMN